MCFHIILGDGVPNMTLSISTELQKKMNVHKEVRWSQVAREAFENRLQTLEWMDEALKNSKLTQVDAEKIGEEVKRQIWKRFEKRFSR